MSEPVLVWARNRWNDVSSRTNRPQVLRRLGAVGLAATTLLLASGLVAVIQLNGSNAPLPDVVEAMMGATPSPVVQLAEVRPEHGGSPSPGPTSISTWYNGLATPGLAEEPGPASTPTAYFSFMPALSLFIPTATRVPEREHRIEPPPVPPTPIWPPGLSRITSSKLGIHVVMNNDPFIMEFIRRVRPRVVKSVNDLGWLADVKIASPNTVTIGRLTDQDESMLLVKDPSAAADEYIASQIQRYRLNPGADYWEGWNEFVPVNDARMIWYAQFEAARVCKVQELGLRGAVGGFSVGVPEWHEMLLFLPALEAAARCGGIFTLHEYNSPTMACGTQPSRAGQIPGAPDLGDMQMGFLTLRYRFWYEGILKPRGLGHLPLVISELGIANIATDPACNDPGGDGWRQYADWIVRNGHGPDAATGYVNILGWYDDQMRQDDYVWGATIFTAGAREFGTSWSNMDIHDALVPLAYWLAARP